MTTKTKDKPKEAPVAGSIRLKDPKWELFAYLYCGFHNGHLFGNGTACYLEAYGYTKKITENEEKIAKALRDREKGFSVVVGKLEQEIKKWKNSARASGCQLLARPSVRQRCDFLLSELCDPTVADRELTFVMVQRDNLEAKVSAIREYNRVKARVKPENLEGDFTFHWADDEEEEEEDDTDEEDL